MSNNNALIHAYDDLAENYEDLLIRDTWMREILWSHYQNVFQPGQHVLEIGCGTGLDTLFLLNLGVHVTAIDISAGMMGQLQQKINKTPLVAMVRCQVLDIENVAQWPDGDYAGIIAGFAVINTIADVRAIADKCADILPPRGRVIIHVLNRQNIWEWLASMKQKKFKAAFRVWQQKQRIIPIYGQNVTHYFYNPTEFYEQYFKPHFLLRQVYGLGFLRPQATLNSFPNWLIHLLGKWERLLATIPYFTSKGRFFVLDMERR